MNVWHPNERMELFEKCFLFRHAKFYFWTTLSLGCWLTGLTRPLTDLWCRFDNKTLLKAKVRSTSTRHKAVFFVFFDVGESLSHSKIMREIAVEVPWNVYHLRRGEFLLLILWALPSNLYRGIKKIKTGHKGYGKASAEK